MALIARASEAVAYPDRHIPRISALLLIRLTPIIQPAVGGGLVLLIMLIISGRRDEPLSVLGADPNGIRPRV